MARASISFFFHARYIYIYLGLRIISSGRSKIVANPIHENPPPTPTCYRYGSFALGAMLCFSAKSLRTLEMKWNWFWTPRSRKGYWRLKVRPGGFKLATSLERQSVVAYVRQRG